MLERVFEESKVVKGLVKALYCKSHILITLNIYWVVTDALQEVTLEVFSLNKSSGGLASQIQLLLRDEMTL